MFDRHSQILQMFLQNHPVSVPQVKVGVDRSLDVQLFGHEVQDGLLLVERSMTLVHVQNQSPVARSSGSVDTSPQFGSLSKRDPLVTLRTLVHGPAGYCVPHGREVTDHYVCYYQGLLGHGPVSAP